MFSVEILQKGIYFRQMQSLKNKFGSLTYTQQRK